LKSQKLFPIVILEVRGDGQEGVGSGVDDSNFSDDRSEVGVVSADG
jgi:hypothetical protein